MKKFTFTAVFTLLLLFLGSISLYADVPVHGQLYKIKNAKNAADNTTIRYLGGTIGNSPNVQPAEDKNEQIFLFLESPENEISLQQLSTGGFVAKSTTSSNVWVMAFTSQFYNLDQAKFTLTDQEDGSYRIRNKALGSAAKSYIAADGTAASVNVVTDKEVNNENGKWIFEAITPTEDQNTFALTNLKSSFLSEINAAFALVGKTPSQQATEALQATKTGVENATSITSLFASAPDIYASINAYKAEVTPPFAPKANVPYRFFAKHNPNVYAADASTDYLTYTTGVVTDNNSQLFVFESIGNGKYLIKSLRSNQYVNSRGNGLAMNRANRNPSSSTQVFTMDYVEMAHDTVYYSFKADGGSTKMYFGGSGNNLRMSNSMSDNTTKIAIAYATNDELLPLAIEALNEVIENANILMASEFFPEGFVAAFDAQIEEAEGIEQIVDNVFDMFAATEGLDKKITSYNPMINALTAAKEISTKIPVGLQPSFNSDINSILALTDETNLSTMVADLSSKISLYNNLMSAIASAKAALNKEGNYPNSDVEKQALQDAIASAVAATPSDDINLLISNLQTASAAYVAKEEAPVFSDLMDSDTYYRMFCADIYEESANNRGGRFAFPQISKDRIEMKGGFSDDQLWIFRPQADGTYRIQPKDSTAGHYLYTRGTNNMTTKISNVTNATSKFKITYEETKNGVSYFRFVANDNKEYLSFGYDGGVEQLKSRGSFGKTWGENTYRIAILEDGLPMIVFLKKGILEAEKFFNDTEKGMTNGKYPEDAWDALNTAISDASALYEDGSKSDEDQAEFDTMVSSLAAALATYKETVVVIDTTALGSKLREAKNIADNAILGNLNGQFSTLENLPAFESAISAASAVYNESFETLVQSAIDEQVDLLTTAIETIEQDIFYADFTALDELIDKASTYAESIVSNDDIADALTSLNGIIASSPIAHDAAVSQQTINDAVTTLQAEIDAFLVVLKAGLNTEIENAGTYISGVSPKVPTGTTLKTQFDILTAYVDGAKIINNSTDLAIVTQVAVFEKENGIVLAIDRFELQFVTFFSGELQALITKAETAHNAAKEEAEGGIYPNGSKATLQDATTVASTFLLTAETSNDDFAGVISTLQDAIEDFLSAPLRKLIETAQATHDAATEGSNAGQYPTGSKAILQIAINSAKTVLQGENPNYTAAYNTLDAAYKDFLSKVGTSIDEIESNNIAIYATNQTLYISGLTSEISITGYDLNGRTVFIDQSSASEYTRTLPSGNYIISLKGYVNGNRIVIVK